MVLGAIIVVIITIFLPPLGVFLIAGCGADFLINILLTILGVIPGHIHAFYCEYIYYKRKEQAQQGILPAKRAGGIYSERVQTGGHAVPVGQTAGVV